MAIARTILDERTVEACTATGEKKPKPQAVAMQPPRRIRTRLDSLPLIERELGRLYRAARCGQIDVGDASRLSNILWLMSRVRETGTLEERIVELERTTEPRP